jgi:hypothetical protein
VVATTFAWVSSPYFWINVAILTATYGIFALGIQLNKGTTGITNLAQAGFMAIGAYTFAILVCARMERGAMLVSVGRRNCSRARQASIAAPANRLLRRRSFRGIVRYLADNSRDDNSSGDGSYNNDWFSSRSAWSAGRRRYTRPGSLFRSRLWCRAAAHCAARRRACAHK